MFTNARRLSEVALSHAAAMDSIQHKPPLMIARDAADSCHLALQVGVEKGVMQRRINDPEYWRKCAAEARAEATRMETEERRRIMLRIASDYDLLAERAEERRRANRAGRTNGC